MGAFGTHRPRSSGNIDVVAFLTIFLLLSSSDSRYNQQAVSLIVLSDCDRASMAGAVGPYDVAFCHAFQAHELFHAHLELEAIIKNAGGILQSYDTETNSC